MKKTIFLILFMTVCLVTHNQAQCVVVIQNPSDMLMGFVEDGTIYYDASSDKILDFATDGEVQYYDHSVAATYSRITGEVRDQNNDLILIVESDGDILDAQSQLLAHVDESGVMRDADNYLLMTIAGADPFYISYYYFYYFMM